MANESLQNSHTIHTKIRDRYHYCWHMAVFFEEWVRIHEMLLLLNDMQISCLVSSIYASVGTSSNPYQLQYTHTGTCEINFRNNIFPRLILHHGCRNFHLLSYMHASSRHLYLSKKPLRLRGSTTSHSLLTLLIHV